MSKFNKVAQTTKKTNLAGGIGYAESPELELVSLLLTSFVEDKFYESASEQLIRLKNLAESIKDKKFLAQAAIFARNEFGMRSITHALAGEIVRLVKGEQWTKDAINKIIFRPDDMLEILSYYGNNYGKPIPNSLKKGFTLALEKFDAYKLAKYRGTGKDVKLVDIINLVHPTGKNAELYGKLIKGELKNTETWESKLSEAGKSDENVEELKNAAWKDLLRDGKLGYLAAIRNVRNIEATNDDETIDLLCATLTNRNAILKSKVFPFQLDKAKDFAQNRKVINALSTAMDIAFENVPKFDGKTCIVVDTSGSMSGQPIKIASLFAASLYKANLDSDIIVFGSRAEFAIPNPNDSITTIANDIAGRGLGGTDFSTAVKAMNKAYDRIIILSDMQGWSGNDGNLPYYMNAYKAKFNINPFIYSFDLAGHGTLKFPERNVITIAGFSEKIFDVMQITEQDRNALINKIKAIAI